jgi:hypothetical protein
MTETNNTAGCYPGGVSDVRSTASVDDNLPCPCGKVRRCAYVGCFDLASVPLTSEVAYCDSHSTNFFRSHLRRAQLEELDELNDPVVSIDDVVGQGVFVSHALYYPKRDRFTFDGFTSKSFRFGRVKCDRCDATWLGIEHELCAWCVNRAYLLKGGTK